MPECLKCKSSDMSKRTPLKSHNILYGMTSETFLGVNVPVRLYPTIEVCMSCGFIEYYLDEEDRLKLKNLDEV